MHDAHQAARLFARLSRELMQEPEERVTLEAVVHRARGAVPGCEFASISLRRRRGRVETSAATAELAGRIDGLQYELGEGPCVDAVWKEEGYVTDDIRSDPRWPQWGPRVGELGVRSVLAVRLSTPNETIGALNLYSRGTAAFDENAVDLAVIFATHAANAVSAARMVSGLQTAVASRHLIGVAQGILMTTYDLTMPQSFEVLRRYSSHTNVKLRDLAEFVVENRILPDAGRQPQ